jgi:hypothetical protein
MEDKGKLVCKVIDSDMNLWTIKQEKMQELFSNLSPLDIIEQVGNEDIFELVWEIICSFKCNKYDLEYIVNRLNEIIVDMGV